VGEADKDRKEAPPWQGKHGVGIGDPRWHQEEHRDLDGNLTWSTLGLLVALLILLWVTW